MDWVLDESIWDLYEIIGQPASVMVSSNDVIVDAWFGAVGEDELRAKFDLLAGT